MKLGYYDPSAKIFYYFAADQLSNLELIQLCKQWEDITKNQKNSQQGSMPNQWFWEKSIYLHIDINIIGIRYS